MEEVLLPTSLYFLINTLNPSSLQAQCISAVRVQLVLLLLEVSAGRCRKTLSCSSCPEASSCLWKTTSTISTRDQQVNRSMLHFLSFLTHASSLLVAQPSSLEGASSDHQSFIHPLPPVTFWQEVKVTTHQQRWEVTKYKYFVAYLLLVC